MVTGKFHTPPFAWQIARYSRIGLLKPDAEQFIQFKCHKQHGLNATTT